MNKLSIIGALAAVTCLGSCSTLEGWYHDIHDGLLGKKQVVQFAPEDASTLTAAAFEQLDKQVPPDRIPRVFVVVNTHKLDAAIQQMSGKEKLAVDFSAAKQLVREAIAQHASDKGWSPPPNEAVEAAAHSLGIVCVEDAVNLPAMRKKLGEQLGMERSQVIDQVLYADIDFGQSDTDANKGQFRMTLQLQSLNGDSACTSVSKVDKVLPGRGLFTHIGEWTSGLQNTGLVTVNGRGH